MVPRSRTLRFAVPVAIVSLLILVSIGLPVARASSPAVPVTEAWPTAGAAVVGPLLAYARVVAVASEFAPYAVPVVLSFQPNVTGGTLPYSVAWNFGDGSSPSHGWGPTHRFTVSGLYRATLVVTDALGTTTTATVGFETFDPSIGSDPVNPSASPDLTVVDQYVRFQPPIWSALPLGYNWSFGDGTNSTAREPDHLFTSYGTFAVVLWEEVEVDSGAGGGVDTWNLSFITTVLVRGGGDPPVATLDATFEGFVGSCAFPSRYSETITPNADGPAGAYDLDFGDGNSWSGSVGDVNWRGANHVYQTYGPVAPRMAVTTADGRVATATLVGLSPPAGTFGGGSCVPFPPPWFGPWDATAVVLAIAVYLVIAVVAVVVLVWALRPRKSPPLPPPPWAR